MFLLILGGSALYFYDALFDDPRVFDQDLELHPLDTAGPTEENASFWLAEAVEAVRAHPRHDLMEFEFRFLYGFGDVSSITDEDSTWFVENNRRVAKLLARAVRAPYMSPDAAGQLAPDMDVFKVVAILAAHARECGDRDAATSMALDVLNAGMMVQAASRCMVEYLVGMLISEYGLRQIHELSLSHSPDRGWLRRILPALDRAEPSVEQLQEKLRREYLQCRDELFADLDQEIRGTLEAYEREAPWLAGMSWRLLYKPKRTRNLLAKATREAVELSRRPFREIVEHSFEVPASFESRFDVLRDGNVAGRVSVAFFSAGLRTCLETRLRRVANVRATRIACVIRAFEAEQGALPESLHQLVPRYLASVPSDPFDDQEFRYSRERGRVWSIGPDLTDHGGKGEDWESGRADLPLRVMVAEE